MISSVFFNISGDCISLLHMEWRTLQEIKPTEMLNN